MEIPKNNSKKTKKDHLQSLYRTATFSLALVVFLVAKAFSFLAKFIPQKISKHINPPFKKAYLLLANLCNSGGGYSISRLSLIDLAFRNMSAKKSRTFITIGGMAIGISAIVFLVSIGYGLQELVISRVAKLGEMQQANVTHQPGSRAKIDDRTLSRLGNIEDVSEVLPMIAVVGTVSYQNSISDMAVYGVTSKYLENSAVQPTKGTIFNSDKVANVLPADSSSEDVIVLDETDNQKEIEDVEVAGIQTEAGETSHTLGEQLGDLEFSINPGNWLRVRTGAGTNAEIVGYTKRVEGVQNGVEIAGLRHSADDELTVLGEDEDGNKLSRWVRTKVYLWEKKICDVDEDPDCVDGSYVVMREDDDARTQKEGYISSVGLKTVDVSEELSGKVDADEPIVKGEKIAAKLDSIDVSKIDWEDLGTELVGPVKEEEKKVNIEEVAQKEAVVNRAMLKVLNMDEDQAVGKLFEVSFVAVGELLENPSEKIKSEPTNYKIVGVTPDEKAPLFYVPFIDLRSMGIVNYSQAKIIAADKDGLEKIRKNIEAMGFLTSSVVDTVNQISSLFATARLVLALVGMIALAVASLGMFNTLTVSLLERTREVGLMKAMGMRSVEIRELFLVESMLMGFFGGLLGIVLGFVGGKVLGAVLSLFSFFKGVGIVDVTHLPLLFVAIIVFLSLAVGIGTGIYPARRAKKISALNALRYE